MSEDSADVRKVFDDVRSLHEKLEAKMRGVWKTSKMEAKAAKRKRSPFLDAIQAVSLPIELYAFWLDAHLRSGGRLSWSNSYNFGYARWLLATTWPENAFIPEAYGSDSIKLMVLPDFLP